MLSEISNNINIISAFQLLILAYIVFYNKSNKKNNIFLILFLLLNAFLVISNYIYSNEYFSRNVFPIFYYIIKSSFLLLGPLLFLYTISICYNNFKPESKHLLHLSSFVGLLLFFLIEYFFRLNQFEENTSFSSYTLLGFSVFWSTYLIQLLIYIVLSLLTLKTYKKSLKNIYSFTNTIDHNWLHFLILVYLIHWLLDTLSPIFYLSGVENIEWYTIASILSILTLLFFITSVVIKGLKIAQNLEVIERKQKYAGSSLSENNSKKYFKDITEFVKSEKPYLNPTLKITDLAQAVSIPDKYISQSINQYLEQNFFDFINGYRIGEAKKSLSNSFSNNKQVLEIAFDSGFNSKTAFNRAFKKHTGLTPTQYKNSISSSS